MLDINFLKNNVEIVKENIKKKFQDSKLPLVDEVISLDKDYRDAKKEADELRNKRNVLSEKIGGFMREKKLKEADEFKAEVSEVNKRIAELEAKETELDGKIKPIMMRIPNIIANDVPIGKNDAENVERKRFLEPKEKPFDIPKRDENHKSN